MPKKMFVPEQIVTKPCAIGILTKRETAIPLPANRPRPACRKVCGIFSRHRKITAHYRLRCTVADAVRR